MLTRRIVAYSTLLLFTAMPVKAQFWLLDPLGIWDMFEFNWYGGETNDTDTPEQTVQEAKPDPDALWYRQCTVRLESSSSERGLVYIASGEGCNVGSKPEPGSMSRLEGVFAARMNEPYHCSLIAFPIAGYVLDGFVEHKRYVDAGNEKKTDTNLAAYYFHDKDGGRLRSGGSYRLSMPDQQHDTTNEPKFRQQSVMDGYSESQVATTFIPCAVFREAKSQTVVTQQAGTLEQTVNRRDAIDVDNLTVVGPLNATDMTFLRTMVTQHNLVRINLDDAKLAEIPAGTFRDTPLYELQLPHSGLERIGSKAFANCRTLLGFEIPTGTDIADDAFDGCASINLAINVDNPDGRTGHFDELQPIPVSERTDLTDVTDVMPQFPGGEAAMQQYLLTNMKYPVVAAENGIKGSVIVQAAIEADGTVAGGAQVVKSVDPSLDREALRLVHAMPKWTPGRRNGQPTPMKVTIVVRFK